MATLREELKFLDTIMNKVNKTEFYMIIKVNLHNVWVVDIDGKKDPFEMPVRMVNFAYIKVDPKVVKVLYGEAEKTDASSDAHSADGSGNTDSAVQPGP